MTIYEQIKQTYPTLEDTIFINGNIKLEDDGDGIVYIAEWNIAETIPDGLSVGKQQYDTHIN